MATRIGCDKLYYAKITTEGDVTTLPVWETPVAAPGVMSLNINPNPSQETLFYDDGPAETAATLGVIEVSINKNELTATQKKDLLGHITDENEAVVSSGNDNAPWVAVGYRTLKSNGTYRYVWLYQGKFMEPEDNSETKGDTLNFQSETIVGHFVKIPTIIKVKETGADVTGIEKQPWRYEIDEETPSVDTSVIDAWFDQVTTPAVVV